MSIIYNPCHICAGACVGHPTYPAVGGAVAWQGWSSITLFPVRNLTDADVEAIADKIVEKLNAKK